MSYILFLAVHFERSMTNRKSSNSVNSKNIAPLMVSDVIGVIVLLATMTLLFKNIFSKGIFILSCTRFTVTQNLGYKLVYSLAWGWRGGSGLEVKAFH